MLIIRKLKISDVEEVNAFIEDTDNKIVYGKLEENPFVNLYVILDNQKIIGYLNYSIIYDRVELNYICVIPSYRHKGIATKLLSYMLSDADNKKCSNITLEVRENNAAAISLYKKLGFKVVATRKKYYKDVDGLLMIKELGD